ncbi:hypothetical protein CRBSH125_09640 [Afipia carboxidovorans]|nr:hypothetical protein CRBSH125_09640 [Afipia carboxidovorans]
MTRIIKSISLSDLPPTTWRVPTRAEALSNSLKTWGQQYDPIERAVVKGGLPIVIERLAS